MAILDEKDRAEIPGLYNLHDISAIQEQAMSIAESLGNPTMQGYWRHAYETELDNALDELVEDIDTASALEVVFPERFTRYSSRYDGLLSVMGMNIHDYEQVGARIPRDAITSIKALPNPNSVHDYNPQLWLQVRTGLEKPVEVFDRSRATSENPSGIVELPSRGRWVNFALGSVSLKGIYSADSIASRQVATQ